MKKRGEIIVLNGPSGVGKTTLYKKLLADFSGQLELSVSATTRSPRPNEIDGRDYYFLSPEAFQKKADNQEFVEWANVYGNLYGTLKSEIERIVSHGKNILLDIDIQGGENIKKTFPDSHLIFILPPTEEELIRRLRTRNTESKTDFQRRIDTAVNEVRFYYEHTGLYHAAVENNNVEEAYSRLKSIVRDILTR